jgi:hypothetical protein
LKKLDLGQSLGIIANAGVLIGILLLVYELNQNSDLMRAQIHQSRADAYVSLFEDRADAEYLVPALEKVRVAGGWGNPSALDQLTDDELARVRWYLGARRGDYENLYYQYQQGFLDEEYYQTAVVNGIATFAPWWEKLEFNGGTVRPSFRAEVERIVAVYE